MAYESSYRSVVHRTSRVAERTAERTAVPLPPTRTAAVPPTRTAPPPSRPDGVSRQLADERRRERILALEADISRRQLEQSQIRERTLETQGRELAAASSSLKQSLDESYAAERELRQDSYALAHHLQDAVDELNRSQEAGREMQRDLHEQQRTISHMQTELSVAEGSRSRYVEDINASRRDATRARTAADLERSRRRQVEASAAAKGETIHRLGNESVMLRHRVREAVTGRDELAQELSGKNQHIDRLTKVQLELEERLGMTRQQLARTEQVVDEVRNRMEQNERDFNFRYAALEQERQSALHELESTRGELENSASEAGRLKGQVAEYEAFVDKLRGEIRNRDEALDAKQREIRSWADECERVRREGDDARRKVTDINAAHGSQAKDYQCVELSRYFTSL